MAIKKNTDIGNTGMTGDHWALCDMQLHASNIPNSIKVIARYALWLSEAAKNDGRAPLRRSGRMTVLIDSADARLSDIEAALDKELTRATVGGTYAVAEVKAQAAVKAKAAVKADPDKGIKAQPKVEARAAVKAVKGKPAVHAVKGGELEGGTII